VLTILNRRGALLFLISLCLLQIPMTQPAAAQTAHIEIHPINTLTLSDHQFLTGSKRAKAAVIAGELRVPVGPGPFPAVILIHGSGGVGGNVDRWSHEFNAMGIAAFAVDSFTGRGITSTIPDQSQLGSLAMIYDAYRALELLSKNPRIDKSRIALMGFSKGGFATLYASMKRFQGYYAPAGVQFAAYLPFYPRCDISLLEDEQLVERPIRLFHGEADDWVPVEPTRHYVERLRQAGYDVQLTTYPDTRHAFDNPVYPPVFSFSDAELSTKCRLAERGGYIMNLDTGKPFTHKDACITRGATVGYHAQSATQALQSVKAFLTDLFKLPLAAK
jgi:dienelactone hydrolase